MQVEIVSSRHEAVDSLAGIFVDEDVRLSLGILLSGLASEACVGLLEAYLTLALRTKSRNSSWSAVGCMSIQQQAGQGV